MDRMDASMEDLKFNLNEVSSSIRQSVRSLDLTDKNTALVLLAPL